MPCNCVHSTSLYYSCKQPRLYRPLSCITTVSLRYNGAFTSSYKFIVPDWGDKVDPGIGLLHWPALITKKRKFSSYIRKLRGVGCKVIYNWIGIKSSKFESFRTKKQTKKKKGKEKLTQTKRNLQLASYSSLQKFEFSNRNKCLHYLHSYSTIKCNTAMICIYSPFKVYSNLICCPTVGTFSSTSRVRLQDQSLYNMFTVGLLISGEKLAHFLLY